MFQEFFTCRDPSDEHRAYDRKKFFVFDKYFPICPWMNSWRQNAEILFSLKHQSHCGKENQVQSIYSRYSTSVCTTPFNVKRFWYVIQIKKVLHVGSIFCFNSQINYKVLQRRNNFFAAKGISNIFQRTIDFAKNLIMTQIAEVGGGCVICVMTKGVRKLM